MNTLEKMLTSDMLPSQSLVVTADSRKDITSAEGFLDYVSPLKEGLFSFILKTLNFSEDADDVFQDTLLRAFKYIYSFDRKRSFQTWIYAIGHNEIRQYFSRIKNMEYTFDESFPGVSSGGNRKIVQDIYEIAYRLGDRQREVFFLFYDSGFSIREIAKITQLKIGHIKFLLHQARESIKVKLNTGTGGKKNESVSR